MRLYTITIRDNGRLVREWETTCTFAAIEFVHAFGTIGFGLFSAPYSGDPIPQVKPTM